VLELLSAFPKARIHIADNFWNSAPAVLDRLRELAGPDAAARLTASRVDLRDRDRMESMFVDLKPVAVVHFAGLKAVGESVAHPLWYYDCNVAGTAVMLEAMRVSGTCRTLVFSSSCTVYGTPDVVPLTEDARTQAASPYGNTKKVIEEMLRDLCASDPAWRVLLLRYFNPVGAHPSGRIGESPQKVPNNLMPYVQRVALGQLPELGIFGTDYATRDGTAVRDYIHVSDLAEAHVAALKRAAGPEGPGCLPVNVGTGTGTTVREMVETFRRVTGAAVPTADKPRRAGDVEAVWAGTERCEAVLGWKASRGIEDMVASQWKWAQSHPEGFGAAPGETGEVSAQDWRVGRVADDAWRSL